MRASINTHRSRDLLAIPYVSPLRFFEQDLAMKQELKSSACLTASETCRRQTLRPRLEYYVSARLPLNQSSRGSRDTSSRGLRVSGEFGLVDQKNSDDFFSSGPIGKEVDRAERYSLAVAL